MEYVTSANIACGGHAGDEATMERTARLALARGVRIGAHPGYPDRANFGRVEMPMPAAEIERTVRQQIERLDAVVRSLGGRIVHVKPHGALYNVAVRNREVARAIASGVAAWDPRVTLFGLAGSPCWTSGAKWASRWRPRPSPTGATSPMARCARASSPMPSSPIRARPPRKALRFAREGKAQTICVHGDTPGAVDILKACREALPYQ